MVDIRFRPRAQVAAAFHAVVTLWHDTTQAVVSLNCAGQNHVSTESLLYF